MLTSDEADDVLRSVGLIEGLGSDEVRSRIATAVHLAETGKRMLAFYLVEMQEKHLYNDTGHASAAHYAETKHGISDRRARELIALGRRLLRLPILDAAFCRAEIGWTKLVLVARVASEAHEDAWLARALELPCATLKLEIARHREGEAPRDPNDRKGTPEIRFTHSARVDPITHDLVEKAKQMLSDERAEPVSEKEFLRVAAELVLGSEEDGTVPGRVRVPASRYRVVFHVDGNGGLLLDSEMGLLPVVDDGISCDAEILHVEDEYPRSDGESLASEGETPPIARPTSAALREAVLTRDGHRCRCCGSRHGLHVHHIVFRSEGGETRGANEICLCKWCHSRVHNGLLVLDGPDARHVRFLDKEGRPLHEVGELVPPKALGRLEPPVARKPSPEPVEEHVHLATVPQEIDGAWWWRHADLIRTREGARLELRPGRPLPAPADGGPEEKEPVPPDADHAFEGIVGQDRLVARLEKWAKAGEIRGRPYPHTLFLGPPGTGKTTLARCVARRIGGVLHATTGALMKDACELIRLLAALHDGDVLFIDEIHGVPPRVLEVLYEAMRKRRLDLVLHEGARSKTVCFSLPAFTLLAATTEDGDLHQALRSRFGRIETLGFYEEGDLESLAMAKADADGFTLEREEARTLVAYVRGTPRDALHILDCVQDEAAVRKTIELDHDLIDDVCEELGYDYEGRTRDERRYLTALGRAGGPMALGQLSRELGLSERTLLERIEPFLFRRGYVRMTPRGRELAPRSAVRLVGQA